MLASRLTMIPISFLQLRQKVLENTWIDLIEDHIGRPTLGSKI
jgi:hypothetical protein